MDGYKISAWIKNVDSYKDTLKSGRLQANECKVSHCNVSGKLNCDNSPNNRNAVTPMGKTI